MLLECVRRERPSVLIAVQRDYEIWTETLDCIRELGTTVTVAWTTDDSWKYQEVSRFIGHHYDAITTTYDYTIPWYRRDGIPNVFLTQWAANSHWFQPPLGAKDCRYEVSFVGASYGKRRQIVEALRSQGVSVRCFGNGWDHGPVTAERIPHIMRESVVSLNFSDGFKGGRPQLKARTFEVPGAGGMLITEDAPGLDRFYKPGAEILVSRSRAQMVGQVQMILRNHALRDQIAIAGHLRTVEDHSYERRLEKVLEFALQKKEKRKRHAVAFERALRRHRLGPPLRWVGQLVTLGCQKVWGVERGRRAARRIVFELSWRILGEKTFSAVGLPGRLFPEI
jgi:spore maturation protein CgeB